jgi:hypothetical protein
LAKLTLSDIATVRSETATTTINANHALIEAALENTLSRNGTSPNTMSASLDMNSQRILNLPAPVADTEPVRLMDIELLNDLQEELDAAEAHAAAAAASATAAATAETNAETAEANAEAAALQAAASTSLAIAPTYPGGRLTLASGVPVTVSDITGVTTIYYTPAFGNNIPLYNGSSWVATTFTELSLALSANAAHTGYHQSGNNFDLYVFSDAGTLRLGTNVTKWSTSTARGAGNAEVEFFQGRWVNKNTVSMRFGSAAGNTVSVPARTGLYVGSFRTNVSADGQAVDTNQRRHLYNAYNQTARVITNNLNGITWTYNTAAFRVADNDTDHSVIVLAGLEGSHINLTFLGQAYNGVDGTVRSVQVGIGVNSTTVNSAQLFASAAYQRQNEFCFPVAHYRGGVALGNQPFYALEYGPGAGTTTWAAFGTTGLAGLLGTVVC